MKELKIGDSFLFEDNLWEVIEVLSGAYETKCTVGPSTIWLWWPKKKLHDHLLTFKEYPPLHIHTLKLYQGFTDTYNYCIECNHKETL